MNRIELLVLTVSLGYLTYCAVEWTREMKEHARNTDHALARCRVEELS